MSTRCAALGTLVTAILVAGCSQPTVAPSAEASASAVPVAMASPSPSSAEPSPSATLSAAPSNTSGPSGAIDPAAFTSAVTNPWFPLEPGTKLTYNGTKDGKRAVETFTVKKTTKFIDGVECTVIEDAVSLSGVATEKLLGYYAQDREGNVWYFGEDMLELDSSGHVVGTADSWHAGVDKAPPAFYMEGVPTVGHKFAHDYTKNDFAVLSISDKVKVPYGSFTGAVTTKEWSPLEPDVETHKYYVRDVGLVRDVAVKGPTEELVLVKVDHS